MIRLFPAVLALALASCAPAHAKPVKPREPFGPVCVTSDQAIAIIKAKGGPIALGKMEGDAAARLIDTLNHMGKPTAWAATTILIRFYPTHAVLDMFGPCLSRSQGVPYPVLKDALDKAKRTSV